MSSTTTTTSSTDTTSATTTTTDPTTNTTSQDSLQRCYESVLTNSQTDIVKYLMYFCGGWIAVWCIITTLVNICHKNKGHQRYVHLFEELSIILLSICMYILNFLLNDKTEACKFVAIANHFFMCLTSSIFLAEAFFASSMVHGKSDKNGSFPWILYYVLPILSAVLPAIGMYFKEKKYYGTAHLHCFATSTVDMLWGFVIPVWMTLSMVGLKAQLACIACDKQRPSQDKFQCYWARRSVKSLTLISQYLFSIWLMVLFAAEHQKLYLFVLITLMTILFGPALFVCHTYGHTCQKWAGSGCFSNLYAMCPPKPDPFEKNEDDEDEEEKVESLNEKTSDPQENKDELKTENPQTSEDLPQSLHPNKTSSGEKTINPTKHTESQKFYSWLTDSNGIGKSKDILFRPTVA